MTLPTEPGIWATCEVTNTFHADLSHEGGRRIATLPVEFTRRGTVAIDVTAEGVPRGPSCRNGPLRRSPRRTLGVRVR